MHIVSGTLVVGTNVVGGIVVAGSVVGGVVDNGYCPPVTLANQAMSIDRTTVIVAPIPLM